MRFLPVLGVAMLAELATAQTPDSSNRAPRTTVSGVVRDSSARTVLAGAVVQLVAVDQTSSSAHSAVSDSLGRFILVDVPSGRYMIGFFHPLLDSLGVEPPLHEVVVDGRRPVRADLAVPSPARLRAAICGGRSTTDSGTVVIGVVRDARGRAAAAQVTVVAEWIEFTLTAGGLTRRIPRIVATTATNGWFAICNLPGAGTISLMASRGADSTGVIELQVPPERFLRRELYVGPASDGRLAGVVVTAVGARPLAGAQVGILDGPQTRANDRGEWTLVDARVGTRILDVRAVGYYPERQAVDVVTDAPPIRTTLSTMKSVLDTVRVTASRLANPNMAGFEERRRGGFGRYITAEDVARREPTVTSDLFRMQPGLRFRKSDESGIGETLIVMRGTTDEGCSPAVYIDGQYMRDLSAEDIDGWVSPDEIAGIEFYNTGTVPVQYQHYRTDLRACGSIVIWTRPSPTSRSQHSWKVRVAAVVGLAALALGLEALIHRP